VSRRLGLALAAAAAAVGLSLPTAGAGSPSLTWRRLASGLEACEWRSETEAAGPERLALVRLPAGGGHSLRVLHEPGGTLVGQLRDRPGLLTALNANFFDEAGRALGWVVSDGRERVPIARAGWGVLSVGPGGEVRIRRPRAVPAGEAVTQAVQAGPLLVERGQPNPGLRAQSARRLRTRPTPARSPACSPARSRRAASASSTR
jgi:hypothetical protein